MSGSCSEAARSPLPSASLPFSPSLMVSRGPSGAPDLEAICTRLMPPTRLSLCAGLLPPAGLDRRPLRLPGGVPAGALGALSKLGGDAPVGELGVAPLCVLAELPPPEIGVRGVTDLSSPFPFPSISIACIYHEESAKVLARSAVVCAPNKPSVCPRRSGLVV